MIRCPISTNNNTQNLEKYNLNNPQDIFTLSYFHSNPKPFFTLSKELAPEPNKYKPSITHYFIKLLNDKGILLRHYTQNIDGLEVVAGLDEVKCIEAHGHYRTGTCLKCGKKYDQSFFMPKIMNDEIPKCTKTKEVKMYNKDNITQTCDGVVKPDVVFFGEGLPSKFFMAQAVDFKKCDMLIILGTSLKVHPFAGLISKVPKSCPRLLINMEHAAKHELSQVGRDYFLQGKCDDGVIQFAEKLGWLQELQEIMKSGHERIDEQQDEKAVPEPKNEAAEEKKEQSQLSPLGKTALFMAAGRAIETEKKDGEFKDPYAKIFAGDDGFKYLKPIRSRESNNDDIDDDGYSKELLKYIVLRTKWIDDRIEKAVLKQFEINDKKKKKQVVFIGVGCDTRVYRMECLKSKDVMNFELDLEDVIKYRESVLFNKCKVDKNRENICRLAVDLRDKTWINKLTDKGFDINYDTIWIAEGLFSYLDMNELDQLFKTLINDKSDDVQSWIIGTILNANTKMQQELSKVHDGDNMAKMKFKGCSEPHQLLQKYGYNDFDIQPTGGKCKQYDDYLKELNESEKSQQDEDKVEIIPDRLAKSFLFLGMQRARINSQL